MTLLMRGICANGNTRGLLIAGIPGHNGAEVMTGVAIVHGVGAMCNIVMLQQKWYPGTLHYLDVCGVV